MTARFVKFLVLGLLLSLASAPVLAAAPAAPPCCAGKTCPMSRPSAPCCTIQQAPDTPVVPSERVRQEPPVASGVAPAAGSRVALLLSAPASGRVPLARQAVAPPGTLPLRV